MQQSTNYQLNLVEGTDLVNPLTVDKPNYQKIDEVMKTNANNSVNSATATKTETTHAITCGNTDAVFFRFVATSDYTAGDGFTFNNEPVQAVLPDGSQLPTGAFKINGTVLCSIVGSRLTVYANSIGADADIHAADSDKLGGQLPAYYAKAVDGFSTYTESFSASTHALTGSGNNIKFVATADFTSGDTITVNGNAVTAQYVNGESLDTGAWKTGALVTCFLNNNVLNFNGGAGLSAQDKANLVPQNIREGVTIAGVTGSLTTPYGVVGALNSAEVVADKIRVVGIVGSIEIWKGGTVIIDGWNGEEWVTLDTFNVQITTNTPQYQYFDEEYTGYSKYRGRSPQGQDNNVIVQATIVGII